MIKTIRLLLMLCVAAISRPSSAASKPNVLVIIADDMGYGDSQTFWPKSQIRTPSLSRLAKGGIKLTNYHVNPLCTPSRAAFLSGQGTENYAKGGGPAAGCIPGVKLLPQFFKEQGYATGGFGKWHMGKGKGAHPLDRGFDTWIGYHGGGLPYMGPIARKKTMNGRKPYKKKFIHVTDVWADEAIRFIEGNKARPFFCLLAFNAVHGPLYTDRKPVNSGRPDWVKKIAARGVTDKMHQDYIAVVEHMDDRIGTVLDALDRNGLTQDTLVIFFSDNGALTPTYHYAEIAAGDNGPFRAGKATLYEGGICVPAIVRWPGRIPSATESNEFTCHWDFFPTLHEALGLTAPTTNGPLPLRGRSILAHLMSGGKTALGDRTYTLNIGPNRTARLGHWKMVNVIKAIGVKGKSKIRSKPEMPTNGPQLFDLSKDLGEATNVAKQHPEILQRLMKMAVRKKAVASKKRGL